MAKKTTTRKTTAKKTAKTTTKATARKTTGTGFSKKAPIVCQLFSMRDLTQDLPAFKRCIKRLRAIGYEHVQMSGPAGRLDPLEAKAVCDGEGVAIVGSHIALADLKADLAGSIDKLHVWNCPYVAIPSLDWAKLNTAAAWRKEIKSWKPIATALKKEGITLQYHNHAFEFMQFGGVPALELIYTVSDASWLQAEIDTHWVQRGGGDPTAWILAMKGRMDQVHLKDFVMIDNQPTFAEIGAGNMNFEAILAACKKIKVKHYIVEQDQCPVTKNPMKSMKISYENLRAMGL